tara:strand:+ start:25 stop:1950 length:1926 start_codon:yes stop_codon:yes gene_type:complete
MPLQKLQFRPGVNRETTSYTNEGGWFDCDKVRFRFGTPEKIGGWEKYSGKSFLGTCRALHPFVALAGESYLGVGTHLKYYLNEGGGYNDITPIRATTAAGDVTFAAVNGSSTVTVTDASHGALEGDFVTFSGAASLGGNITAAVLNQEYQIARIVNSSSYEVVAREVASLNDITIDGVYTPTPVLANGSDTGNGGGSIVGTYQIQSGLDTTVAGTGWGAGTWSRGAWGSAASLTAVGDILRIWSHDNFGEDLIINVRNGGIYYWDKSTSSAPFARAVELQSLAGADATTPTIAKQVMISDRDRHVIVFGCDAQDNIGVQDPLLIRFSDQENPLIWSAQATNTAGDLRIGTGSEIITALETRQQILVWTDKSLHSMQFLGPPFTFGISMISENITIASPLSAIAVDDMVMWMGEQEFYIYSGQVQNLPCSVKAYVFNDFNQDQAEKVTAAVNSSYSEIWWFYPSASSDTVDRYVIYNYAEQVWYYGNLNRTAWIDRGIGQYPVAASTDGYLYYHEFGTDDGSVNPPAAISSYIESSQMSIGAGDNFVFLSKLIPDVTFDGSTSPSPNVDFTLETRRFPGTDYNQTVQNNVIRSSTVPVEQFTDQVRLRMRGRSFALKIESDTTGVEWRLGTPRVDIRPDGRR